MMKVYESIGNFCEEVFSGTESECVDYLFDRFNESDEEDETLFFSYFHMVAAV